MDNKHDKRASAGRTIMLILAVIMLISTVVIVVIYAKDQRTDTSADSAKTAAAGIASIYEYKAEYDNGVYTLTDEKIAANKYPVLIPGTDIPKSVVIELPGANDISCRLYLEVTSTLPDEVKYSIDGGKWQPTDKLEPEYGGTVYEYKAEIAPHESLVISDVIKNGSLRVSDSFRTDYSDEEFEMKMFAYLVQKE